VEKREQTVVVEEINYPICSPMYSNDYDDCSHCIVKDVEACFWREINTIGINFLQIIRKRKEKQFDGLWLRITHL
jgi:hypothetical protein